MPGWSVKFDDSGLKQSFARYEQRDIPVALVRALNDVAFDASQEWRTQMPQIFDRPVSLTLNAVRWNKASVAKPVATVFILDEIGKGTPPAQYLLPQAEGGTRRGKRSENLLRRAGILGPNEFWVPGQQAPLDTHGNLPPGVVTTILSDVQASFDPLQFSTRESRAKRVRRGSGGRSKLKGGRLDGGGILKAIKRKQKTRGGVYFLSRGKGTQIGPNRIQHLSRGIYERITTGFGGTVRMVMAFVKSVSYRKRFDPLAITQRVFDTEFEERFRVWIERLRIR